MATSYKRSSVMKRVVMRRKIEATDDTHLPCNILFPIIEEYAG